MARPLEPIPEPIPVLIGVWLAKLESACPLGRVLRGWAALCWLFSLALGLQAQPLAPTLAQSYHPGIAVQDYWVSEKYDGVRALWTGRELLTRQGQRLPAPPWFTAGWPDTPLDGELWAGRGGFAQVQSILGQDAAPDSAWRSLRYMVFDLPGQAGGFSQRLALLQQQVAHIGQPWVQAAAQWRAASHAALLAQLQQYERAGAEGLMLRHQGAPYRGGRSSDLLKLKSFEDAEARVIGYLPGRGKYQGMTGALLVQLPDGQQLRLGSGLPEALRRQPPPLGTVVTYRYNGHHASGLPRFARFWRVRELPTQPAAP